MVDTHSSVQEAAVTNIGGAQRPISDEMNSISKVVVDAAYTVHKALGPGLLESVYERCLGYECEKRQLSVQRQVALPIVYDGIQFEEGLRIDLLVENSIIVELKAVATIQAVHQAQLLSYLRLANKRLGFLINFNVPLIKDGIQRFAL